MKSFGYRSDRLRFEWGRGCGQLCLPCKGWIGVGSQRVNAQKPDRDTGERGWQLELRHLLW